MIHIVPSSVTFFSVRVCLKLYVVQDGVTIFRGTRGEEYQTLDAAVEACGGPSKIALGDNDISDLTTHSGATEAVGMKVLFPLLTAQAVHNFAEQIRATQGRPERKKLLPHELVQYVLSRTDNALARVTDFPGGVHSVANQPKKYERKRWKVVDFVETPRPDGSTAMTLRLKRRRAPSEGDRPQPPAGS